MLEYGIKTITTNPTIITKTNEIIKLVDTRANKTRAFVLPASYEPFVNKLIKEQEAKEWAKNKKKLLRDLKSSDELDDLSLAGAKSIDEYLG